LGHCSAQFRCLKQFKNENVLDYFGLRSNGKLDVPTYNNTVLLHLRQLNKPVINKGGRK